MIKERADIAEFLFHVAEKMFSASKFETSVAFLLVVKIRLSFNEILSANSRTSGNSLPINRISDIFII